MHIDKTKAFPRMLTNIFCGWVAVTDMLSVGRAGGPGPGADGGPRSPRGPRARGTWHLLCPLLHSFEGINNSYQSLMLWADMI